MGPVSPSWNTHKAYVTSRTHLVPKVCTCTGEHHGAETNKWTFISLDAKRGCKALRVHLEIKSQHAHHVPRRADCDSQSVAPTLAAMRADPRTIRMTGCACCVDPFGARVVGHVAVAWRPIGLALRSSARFSAPSVRATLPRRRRGGGGGAAAWGTSRRNNLQGGSGDGNDLRRGLGSDSARSLWSNLLHECFPCERICVT